MPVCGASFRLFALAAAAIAAGVGALNFRFNGAAAPAAALFRVVVAAAVGSGSDTRLFFAAGAFAAGGCTIQQHSLRETREMRGQRGIFVVVFVVVAYLHVSCTKDIENPDDSAPRAT